MVGVLDYSYKLFLLKYLVKYHNNNIPTVFDAELTCSLIGHWSGEMI